MNNDFVFDIHKKQYTYKDIVLEHVNQEIIQIATYDGSLSSNIDLPTFLFSLIYRKKRKSFLEYPYSIYSAVYEQEQKQAKLIAIHCRMNHVNERYYEGLRNAMEYLNEQLLLLLKFNLLLLCL